jgi:S1-C subfamily serine protease
VLGYDHESGFGLLQATERLNVPPMPIGKSAVLKTGDPVLAASFGGVRGIAPAYVAARREFAGNWEYLIDEAIFTTPPHTEWSGAALISRDGKLVGVGSLIVPDTTGKAEKVPGNMYVPIDLLAPILDDLAADRRGRPAKPWLGVATAETHGRLFVERVTPGGPAAKAGLQRGDIIVGVGGAAPAGMADFYRKVWSFGNAGVSVPLDVMQGNDKRRVDIKSMNRLDYLRMKTTY